ncbi:hypothetical protein [Crossiella sp. NPDC003009]
MARHVKGEHGAGRVAQLNVFGPPGFGANSAVDQFAMLHEQQFPDGFFVVNFGGPAQDLKLAISEALGSVLTASGVPAALLPASSSDREALFRSRSCGRRLFLKITGVTDSRQVLPFRFESPGSVVAVVTRHRMPSLRAMDFRPFEVPRLPERFGKQLFRRVAGARCMSTLDCVNEVVRGCHGSPLAIQTVAAVLGSGADWEFDELVSRFAEHGLHALGADNDETLRRHFDSIYESLGSQAQLTFRALSCLPGVEFGEEAAAVVLKIPVLEARARLRGLVVQGLLQLQPRDRYTFHESAYWYARRRAEQDTEAEYLHAVYRRLYDWYLETAVRHDATLIGRWRVGPKFRALRPGEIPKGRRAQAAAMDWFETERTNIRGVIAEAERLGWLETVWQLCEALWTLYHRHRHFGDWIDTHRRGLAAAIALNDDQAIMRMTSQLGSALLRFGKPDEAEPLFEQSRLAAERCGDDRGVQSAGDWAARVAAEQGKHPLALARVKEARHVAETGDISSDQRGRMLALLRLAEARSRIALGQADVVPAALWPDVAYFEGIGEPDNQAKVLFELARALSRTEQLAEAAACARQAEELFAAGGSCWHHAATLDLLAEISDRLADGELARRYREDASAIRSQLDTGTSSGNLNSTGY